MKWLQWETKALFMVFAIGGAMENEEDDALEGDSAIGSKVFRAWAEIGLELSFVAHYLIEVHKV